MNKTIYIPQDGEPVWQKALALVKADGTGMGTLFIRLLTTFLAEYPDCACGATLLPQWKHCPACGQVVRRRRAIDPGD